MKNLIKYIFLLKYDRPTEVESMSTGTKSPMLFTEKM